MSSKTGYIISDHQLESHELIIVNIVIITTSYVEEYSTELEQYRTETCTLRVVQDCRLFFFCFKCPKEPLYGKMQVPRGPPCIKKVIPPYAYACIFALKIFFVPKFKL